MITQILVGVLVGWFLMVKWRNRRMSRLAERLRSSLMSPPLLGHSYMLIGNAETMMKGLQRMGRDAVESGGTVAHWFTTKLYITIAEPEVADIVLKNCLEKDDLMRYFHEVIGDGSIFTSVKKWRPRRKFLAPTFNMKNLNRFVDVFAAQSSILAEKLKKVAGQDPMSVWKMVSSYAMDAVCETTMGIKAKAQESDHPNLTAFDKMFHVAAKRICTPWLQFDLFYKHTPLQKIVTENKAQIYKFIDNIITEKRNNNTTNENSTNKEGQADRLKPFVELVLESAAEKSDLIIREECLVLLGAGTDTSAVSVGYAFVMLATHPDMQEKVYQELREIISDTSRPVQADDLHRLKYLDAFVRETLRLYPPVPVITRKIEKDIELPSGVIVPSGCGAIINIWSIHRNPAVWGADAEDFRPERFLGSMPKHPAAFIPFSYGPRNCLGYQYAMMSIKTVLSTVLRKYRLVPPGDQHQPLRVEFEVMMRHVDKYRVGVEIRE